MSLELTQEYTRTKNRLSIANDQLEICVLPDFGGKLTSIRNIRTNTEFLAQSSIPFEKLKKPEKGDDFLPPYAFGFDDCFPNIAPLTLLKSGESVAYPDHGELWTSKMSDVSTDHEIVMEYESEEFGYTFVKRISLQNSTVKLHYSIKNESNIDFRFLWSAHPLLKIDEGDQILLPKSVSSVDVYYASDGAISEKENQKWPLIYDGCNLDRVLSKESNFATKLFFRNIPQGLAGIYRVECDETMLFKFDIQKLPHLGLWLCYNGWPEQSNVRDYALAIEPTTTASDLISDAHLSKGVMNLASGQKFEWNLEISIQKGQSLF